MDGVVRHRRWSLALAGLLCVCLHATAQPRPAAEPSLQVFSNVSRSVVAVGAAFRLDVEVYASPASAEETARVADAFTTARFDTTGTGFDVIREEAMTLRTPEETGGLLVLARRFVLRVLRSGPHEVPPLRFDVGAQAYATAAHAVTAYAVDPVFFQAGASVLPVLAEYQQAGDRRSYARVGSAFLVAPDAVVTSLHVVMDARRVRLMLPGGKPLYTSKAWVLDPVRDVAVLYVRPGAVARAGLTPLRLAPAAGSVAQEPDEAVAFTYGWPGGVQRSTAGVRYRGLTLQPGEALWISANPVRPGDSGGPLLDRTGRVLGVVTSGAVSTGQSEALHEELCIALDPRPALARRQGVGRPRSLRALMRDPAFTGHPHVQAIRLTSMLAAGRRRFPGLDAALARLDAPQPPAPGNARFHFLRGIIHQLLGTTTAAAEAYRAALDAFDGHFLSAYMLGLHHLRRREYRAAEARFRHAQQYAPYRHLAAYGVARALMGRLRYDEAVPFLRAVIAHDPAYAPALYDLARCALARDDEAHARQLLARLEALDAASARRLRRVLREPILRPRVLRELPRATFSLR